MINMGRMYGLDVQSQVCCSNFILIFYLRCIGGLGQG
jgi:hypothetical protein